MSILPKRKFFIAISGADQVETRLDPSSLMHDPAPSWQNTFYRNVEFLPQDDDSVASSVAGPYDDDGEEEDKGSEK